MGALDPGDIISLVMLCICVLTLSLNTWHTSKKDIETDSERITKISTQMDNVVSAVSEINTSMKEIQIDARNDHDRLIKTEQSVKSVWHEVNNLRELSTEKEDSKNENE